MSNDRWIQRWYVESRNDPDKKYTVAQDINGNWGCSCKGWIFNHKKPGYQGDPHIAMVQNAIAGGKNDKVITLADAVLTRLIS